MYGQAVSACLGIATNTSKFYFELFPKPNNSAFSVVLPDQNIFSTLSLYNAIGEKVYELSLSTHKTEVKTSLRAGVYFYVIEQNGEKAGGRLIIQ